MDTNKQRRKIRIAVDAMGGDYGPPETVKGAVHAAREYGVEVILVGDRSAIEKELSGCGAGVQSIRVVEAVQKIEDGEEPAFAVMKKPNSSVALATRLVKDGEADAVISAGSTGAMMVAAARYLGTLPGIERPVAGGPFLGLSPNTVVLDLGANVGCQPYQMVDLAVVGVVYARTFLGIENPTVGLLNVGSEEGKGNEQAKEAYLLLKQSGLNFIGNVEGMDIPFGRANVIVCDGFIGNILVKYSEGLGRTIRKWLTSELNEKLPDDMVENIGRQIYRLMSPAEVMGGGPLWGVNGIAAIAHGGSRAEQIAGTFRQVITAIESDLAGTLRKELERVQSNRNQINQ
ncbi:MAG: phosphate acyltransferase PlsX [Dehalococcoidales bacterium]|jgi:glycerol-3-phosphate acyltransferase PlsX